MSCPNTVFVVDDDRNVTRAVSTLLFTQGIDVRCFDSMKAFLDTMDADTVGCLVTDVHMPGIDGAELQQLFMLAESSLSVVILTARADVTSTSTMLNRGGVQVLRKPYDPALLLHVIKQSLCVSQQLHRDARRASNVEERLRTLTDQELEIMNSMISGEPVKNVSTDLGISMRTVDRRRADILKKMEVGSIGELGILMAGHARFLSRS